MQISPKIIKFFIYRLQNRVEWAQEYTVNVMEKDGVLKAEACSDEFRMVGTIDNKCKWYEVLFPFYIFEQALQVAGDFWKSVNYAKCIYMAPDIQFIPRDARLQRLAHKLPGVNSPAACPVCDKPGRVYTMVVHLNDTHQWDRRRIADWLESEGH